MLTLTKASDTPEFAQLSIFEQAYVEAMFFFNGSAEDGIPDGCGYPELAKQTLSAIRADCASHGEEKD